MRSKSSGILISCAVCFTMLLSTPVLAKLYKWKDDSGQTHYGDKIPAQYLTKERDVLDDRGIVVKTIGRAQTREERDAAIKQKRLAEKKAMVLKEHQRLDRVLLDTYTTERDLIIARDARLNAVDSQIKLSESIMESARLKLERTKSTIKTIKARNREVPKDFYSQLKSEEQDLATHKDVADGHKRNMEAINKQFDEYINRFNELLEIKKEKRRAVAEKRNSRY